MSIEALQRELKSAKLAAAHATPRARALFQTVEKRGAVKPCLRVSASRIDLNVLSVEQRNALRAEFEAVLRLLV